jgi:hypothetical protein
MKLGFAGEIASDLSFREVVKFTADTGDTCVEVNAGLPPGSNAALPGSPSRKEALRPSHTFLRNFIPQRASSAPEDTQHKETV